MTTPPFPPDTILISPRSMAHQLGCWHNDEAKVRSGEHPGWGWVHGATAEQWKGVGEGRPLPAAHGDTSLSATVRCTTCPGEWTPGS
ncbi:hypothetical protein KIK06_04490 [Nocardiopsis sp. EMB25]|uniref:hypothetical protein n=1 Tax=Nocardiopsis sp. EMB25 TaxID=2835867 RepID=UPI002284FB37|nr:hypothetical protein [Nocardiopsis sp. EMB25]MCY9783148.1 hypothetical protein [Nocardiopsis sp. EMB25]